VIRFRIGAVPGAAMVLLAAALRADQFEDAQAEALRNLGAPGGREYDAKLLESFEQRHGKALAECATTVSEVDLEPFNVVLELGSDGHVKQVLLRPANGAAVCLRWSLRGSTFPNPPRGGFWMIAVDPRSRRASAPATPSPLAPPTPTAAAPAPTRAAAPAPAAVSTPIPAEAATPVPAPAAAQTSEPAPVPTALRPAPPSRSGAAVDVRLAVVLAAGEGDDALRRRDTLDAAQRSRVDRGIVAGVGLGSLSRLDAWRGAAGGRVVAALAVHGSTPPTAAELSAVRQARRDGRVAALQILAQEEGVAADDPRLEPWWALAEELELPVAISLGPPSRTAPDPRYRVALGDPLRLEPVLLRHPRLRLAVAQAGWPFADSMAAILRAYPQVFVDTGGIALGLERAELHAYVRRLVDAGFADRILFASGAAEPEQVGRAIEAVESATFLNPEQRRAILHDNAARWLGTSPLAR